MKIILYASFWFWFSADLLWFASNEILNDLPYFPQALGDTIEYCLAVFIFRSSTFLRIDILEGYQRAH